MLANSVTPGILVSIGTSGRQINNSDFAKVSAFAHQYK